MAARQVEKDQSTAALAETWQEVLVCACGV
jgi:hypothetical protein